MYQRLTKVVFLFSTPISFGKDMYCTCYQISHLSMCMCVFTCVSVRFCVRMCTYMHVFMYVFMCMWNDYRSVHVFNNKTSNKTTTTYRSLVFFPYGLCLSFSKDTVKSFHFKGTSGRGLLYSTCSVDILIVQSTSRQFNSGLL